MDKLSHIDDKGKAQMVDVGSKPISQRTAIAEGFIGMDQKTIQLISENQIKKGDVLTVAEIAGIQAAKKTADLIPLCHPLALTRVSVETLLISENGSQGVKVIATAKCVGQTGVEMEALTAASVALLTIYDMCKAVDKTMHMEGIKLTKKTKE